MQYLVTLKTLRTLAHCVFLLVILACYGLKYGRILFLMPYESFQQLRCFWKFYVFLL